MSTSTRTLHDDLHEEWLLRESQVDEPLTDPDEIHDAVSEIIESFADGWVAQFAATKGKVSPERFHLKLCREDDRRRYIVRESNDDRVQQMSQSILEDELKNADHRRLWRHIVKEGFVPTVRIKDGAVCFYSAIRREGTTSEN
jgi:hypothetical protein